MQYSVTLAGLLQSQNQRRIMKLAKIALETPKKNNFSPNLIKEFF